MDIRRYLQEKKECIERALERYFPRRDDIPATLSEAMRYSLFAGGKRIRPVLSIAAFETVGGRGEPILPFACALEMIHTYSLIHDDLPAIDNDDTRRGKPTCHKVFGESMAILAGDALLTEAFRLMTERSVRGDLSCDDGLILGLINQVALAAGIAGMVSGQVVDIESERKEVDLSTVQYIHAHKTGAMIVASVQIGARLGGASEAAFRSLTRYGEEIGLAFQIADDILNVEGNPRLLGKSTGTDLSKRKATYPLLVGLEESKARAKKSIALAVVALRPFGPEADPLREIAHFIVSRQS
jgi:geranylgeranyl diphosphate synthase type II